MVFAAVAPEHENALSEIADKYFALLARSFPIMCASDEFHFLPRVQGAAQLLDQVDSLSREAIAAALESVKEYQQRLRRLSPLPDFEDEIDRQLLLHNMAAVLIEFEEIQSWRHNPLLYLKVACIGVDQALNKPAASKEESIGRTLERLAGVRELLSQGERNLTAIPAPYYRAASAMAADAQEYLTEILYSEDGDSRKAKLELPCREAREALAAFGGRLRRIGPTAATAVKSVSVQDLVRRHFGCARSLEEIYDIAQNEWQDSQDEMERLRRSIDNKQQWQQLYEAYRPATGEDFNLFQLYGAEISSLREFCHRLNLVDGQVDQEVMLTETPTYLRSVRSAASYSSPLGVEPQEQACFYITSGSAKANSKMDMLRKQRLHREYRFLSAHETYPGHHLLDSIRRHLANPVRRQIESPLFYEGWAYYAESILTERGHVNEPLELLVDCKRRLWRAARCMIDAGLATGQLAREEAAELLVSVNFAADEAIAQVERFRLNPGYQLCYSLGKYEIMELRHRFVSGFGWQRFHRLLLEGGEIPFRLAGWRFENLSKHGRSGDPASPWDFAGKTGGSGSARANEDMN